MSYARHKHTENKYVTALNIHRILMFLWLCHMCSYTLSDYRKISASHLVIPILYAVYIISTYIMCDRKVELSHVRTLCLLNFYCARKHIHNTRMVWLHATYVYQGINHKNSLTVCGIGIYMRKAYTPANCLSIYGIVNAYC